MARYEGMDEIIQRLRERASHHRSSDTPAQPVVATPEQPPSNRAFDRATEQIMVLLRAAEDLHILLLTERVQTFSSIEQDDLLARLGKVVRELESCEAVLQRVAPID